MDSGMGDLTNSRLAYGVLEWIQGLENIITSEKWTEGIWVTAGVSIGTFRRHCHSRKISIKTGLQKAQTYREG